MYRYSRAFGKQSPALWSRNGLPLADEQIRQVAPSIFAEEAHDSRSDRYAYIPTSNVLSSLKDEGFQPFMVAQTRVRDEGRRDYTKHMIRLRHVSRKSDTEADEVILLNSHDGTSSYQMLAGQFRFVCMNGLVAGNVVADVRIPHKGSVVDGVIKGAYDVLDGFDLVREVRDDMRAITLDSREEELFAQSALALRYDADVKPAPITESQLLRARRAEDAKPDLWSAFNRVQENMLKGGLRARTATNRRTSTREVQGIDQGVKLNRALWVLAEGMKALKG